MTQQARAERHNSNAPTRFALRQQAAAVQRQQHVRIQRETTSKVAFVLLFVLCIADFFGGSASLSVNDQSTFERQALFSMLFVGMLAWSAWNYNVREMWAFPVAVTVALGYCALSIGWAIEPSIATRRFILTAMTVWMTFSSLGKLPYAKAVSLVRTAMLALLALNYFAVIFTSYGIQADAFGESDSVVGKWRGILQNKNVAGAMCAYAILFLVFHVNRTRSIGIGALLFLAAVFLYFSGAKTSIIALAVAVPFGFFVSSYKSDRRAFYLFSAIVVIIAALQVGSFYSGRISDELADPGGFTGRSQIWPMLIAYASDHLWLGAGFGSFWRIGAKSPMWSYTDGWVAQLAGHGHNGYLDLLVTIGAPGLAIAVGCLLVWPLLRLLLSRTVPAADRGLLASLAIFFAIYNITESAILAGSGPVQVMFAATLALIYSASNGSSGKHHAWKFGVRRYLRAGPSTTPA